ncbi:MAG: ABC transporter permease [Cyclobacteriaceae bacterium]
MLRNYLKIALRSLTKNSTYSFINIGGLAIGIACSLLIMLWVFDELSFDRFHPNVKRLTQLWVNATFDGNVNSFTSAPLPSYEKLKTASAQIKNTAVTDWGGDYLLAVGEKRIQLRGHYASPEFLEMFPFPVVKGDAASVLDDPQAIVLTESAARSLFGDKDPLGQVVLLDNSGQMKVTGILKDVPSNSSFQFSFLASFEEFRKQDWVKRSETSWGNYSFPIYVELQSDDALPAVNEAIRDILTKEGQTDVKREFFLHPMERWNLYSNFSDGKESGGRIEYVRLFSIIAAAVLVIACINFMNLATARSERRAKEVGIRKSVGSRRRDLMGQFIGESLFITTLAFLVSLVLVELSLPFYNVLVEKQLGIPYSTPSFWAVAALLILVTGLVAGSYPAFYLSAFNPVTVLKGKLMTSGQSATPRQVLVAIQFVFSMLLVIGTIVIYRQIQHVQNRDLGYNQKNLITIDYTTDIGKNYKAIREELTSSGAIASMTRSNSPVTAVYSNNFLDWPGKPDDQKVLFNTIATEYDYTRTMGIKVLEGRDFSESFPGDSSSILLNKSAVETMGVKDPLGMKVSGWGQDRTVVGVIDNVLMGNPYSKVPPMFIVFMPYWTSAITVRLSENGAAMDHLKKVEEVFKKYNPSYPFTYRFVDVEYGRKFSALDLVSQLARLFTVLTIIITCLGLFGLAAFTAERRTKEIGIRKVLGASVTSLIMMMTRDFSKLVLIAFVLAAPLAWWLVDWYLQQYEYRVAVEWWNLLMAGGLALLLTLLIVGAQALRAASVNPGSSLRSE